VVYALSEQCGTPRVQMLILLDMSDPAPELSAESEPLAGAAENARRGVVTHITIRGERVAAIVPESLIKVLNDLVAVLTSDQALSALPWMLAEVFPWARALPPHELKAFARELRQATVTGAPGATELIERVLAGWHATAEAYADPAILRALRVPAGDYGPVPEPHVTQ
jgi:hypothetical protein